MNGLLSLVQRARSQTQINDALWKRITAVLKKNTNNPLKDLFLAAHTPAEKSVMGNLMYETGLRLPLRLERKYLESLVLTGSVKKALALSRSRVSHDKVYSEQTRALVHLWAKQVEPGLQIANRVLSKSKDSLFLLNVLKATSHLPQSTLEPYLGLLDAKETLAAVKILAKSKRWGLLESLYKHTKNPQHLQECLCVALLNSHKHEPDERTLAQLLKSAPGIINRKDYPSLVSKSVPKCRSNGPEYLDYLLSQRHIEQAWGLYNRSFIDLESRLTLLNSLLFYAVRQKDTASAQKVVFELSKLKHAAKNPRFVAIWLNYLFFARQFEALYEMIDSLVDTQLNRKTVPLAWSLLRKSLNKSRENTHHSFSLESLYLKTATCRDVTLSYDLGQTILQTCWLTNHVPLSLCVARMLIASDPTQSFTEINRIVLDFTAQQELSAPTSLTLSSWKDMAALVCDAFEKDVKLVVDEASLTSRRLGLDLAW